MKRSSFQAVGSFVCGMVVMMGLTLSLDSEVRAETKRLVKEFLNPTTMNFTNTVTASSGGIKTIYVSGQVGYEDSNIPEDAGEQADIAFRHIVEQLKDAGATVEDVVKINVYLKDLNSADTGKISAAKNKYFTQENQPASTWVGVTSLLYPQIKVEIEVIAIVEAA